MLSIDGSKGEGGGQILRTSLTCSLLTGVPFHIERIRAGRRRSGLLPQHLAAVNAAAEIGAARTEGATPGSETLAFHPGEIHPGSYRFDIGTAGSVGLVLQTVLVPLLAADGESQLVIAGGTHNEGAPPFEFLNLGFAPLLRRMGADLSLSLERMGFYPAGGGRIRVRIGNAAWERLELTRRGSIRSVSAHAVVSRLPLSIAERELAVVRDQLGWPEENLQAVAVDTDGPGNALMLTVETEYVTEVFTGFGRRGLPAEEVASRAVAATSSYLDSGVAIGTHLADQLLLPLTQAGGGNFHTMQPSKHFVTNVGIIERFFDLRLTISRAGKGVMIDCRAHP